jgi:integration host factor subunit beta
MSESFVISVKRFQIRKGQKEMQTTTKRDLCEKIVRKTDNSQLLVKETIQMFLDRIVHELSQGNRIELRDFGVFEVKQRAARKARNPRTGEEAFVPAKNVVVFKVGKLMKEKVNDSTNKTDQTGNQEISP